MNVPKPSESRLANRVEMGGTSTQQSDDIDDSLFDEYKGLSYRLFQLRDYKVKSSYGEFICPFCSCEKDAHHDYTHLLQHAICVAESSLSRKQRAKHLAMARYLAIDLSIEGDHCQKNPLQITSGRKRSKPSGYGTKHEKVGLDRIRELESEIDDLNDEMNALITKDRVSNYELQIVHRELIEGLMGMHLDRENKSDIGIKKLGELNLDEFVGVLRAVLFKDDVTIKAVELCSSWQEKIKDPHWYPFRIVEDASGIPQRVVNDEDVNLRALKREWWGDWLHDEVVRALTELQEHNASGCYMVPELWNFAEGRKAGLGEVIRHVFRLGVGKGKLETPRDDKALSKCHL